MSSYFLGICVPVSYYFIKLTKSIKSDVWFYFVNNLINILKSFLVKKIVIRFVIEKYHKLR